MFVGRRLNASQIFCRHILVNTYLRWSQKISAMWKAERGIVLFDLILQASHPHRVICIVHSVKIPEFPVAQK